VKKGLAMTKKVLPWTVRASRRLIGNRWIKVRSDECVTPDGVVVPDYYVLEYPGWVSVAALDADDNIILVRQYRHALGAVSLELPGGCIDDGETPVEAGARELLEETGYGDAARLTLVNSLSPNAAMNANLIHTVLAEGVSAIAAVEDDGVEVLEVERVPYREAIDLALRGAIMQSTHVASLFAALVAAKKIVL
jgi:8-oxo-dGDP phosphatase